MKKWFKKITAMALALSLSISFASIGVSALKPDPFTIRIESVSVNEGTEEALVGIFVDNGPKLTSLNVRMLSDDLPAGWRFKRLIQTEGGLPIDAAVNIALNTNVLVMSATSSYGGGESAKHLTVVFDTSTLSPGDYNLHLNFALSNITFDDIYNENPALSDITLVPGKITVRAISAIKELPTPAAAVYGMTYSEIALNGGVGVDGQGATIDGSFSWDVENSSAYPIAGQQTVPVLFTPTSSGVASSAGQVTLNVAKAPMNITVPDFAVNCDEAINAAEIEEGIISSAGDLVAGDTTIDLDYAYITNTLVSNGRYPITVTTTNPNYELIINNGEGDGAIVVSNAENVPASVTLSHPSAITVGKTGQASVRVISVQGTEITNPDVVWSISNESYATISETGLITGVSPGNVLITAKVGKITVTSNSALQISAEPVVSTPVTTTSRRRAGGAASGTVATSTLGLTTLTETNAQRAVDSMTKSIADGKSKANTPLQFSNVSIITVAAANAITEAASENDALTTKVVVDRRDANKKLDVRVILDAAKITKDTNAYGSAKDKTANAVLTKFNKFYSNEFVSISLGQKGSFGQSAEIVVFVGKDVDASDIRIYSYDVAGNKVSTVKNANPKVDKNGFLHFNSSIGGQIVISLNGTIKK
ncbi:MAG: Ig-like domain-containing protein [Eubacterium sp.]|nr:Ig-like domain-containing protein [Eubacterium sp.]